MNSNPFVLQEETNRLIKLLEKFLLSTPESQDRIYVLKNSGIDKDVINIVMSSRRFEESFAAISKDFQVSVNRPDYHPLICLLKYLNTDPTKYILGVNDDDMKFCNKLIARGENIFKELKTNEFESFNPNESYKVDKDFISNFDIDKVEAKFIDGLASPEGILAFFLSCRSDDVLRNYILNRLLTVYKRKMKEKCRNYNEPYHIYLDLEDMKPQNGVYDKIQKELGSIQDLCRQQTINDYILIIWNTKIPPREFNEMVKNFWGALNRHRDSFCHTNRRIILILMNQTDQNKSKIKLKDDRFLIIKIPEKVNIIELKDYIHNRLKRLHVHTNRIQYHIQKLGDCDTSFDQAHIKLWEIAENLRGETKTHE